MSWKIIAYQQGQTRLPKETADEFEKRVMKLYRRRVRNGDTDEWHKDSGH